MKCHAFLLAGVFAVGGCDRVSSMLSSTPSPEEIKAQQERLQQADAQVARLAETAGATAGRFEGLTEADPWGTQLRVEYSQDWTMDKIIARSAGPDRTFESGDDLIRTRERTNVGGILRGVPTWAWVATVWVVCAILAATIRHSHRRTQALRGRRVRRGIGIGDVGLVAFAPIALVIFGFVGLAGLVGIDWGDPFDFDLGDIGGDGFDLDIDL